MFRFLIAVYVWAFRLTGGVIGGRMGLPVLLLRTTGRKTGRARTVPLGYVRHGTAYVVVASYAGNPHHPAWYHNLVASPQATIQLRWQQIPVLARVLADDERAAVWANTIAESPAYVAYQDKTTRVIPLVALTPVVA